MSRLQIREDDLTGKKIIDLLREHLENMHESFATHIPYGAGLLTESNA